MTSKEEIPLVLRAAYLALHRQSDAAFSEYGVTADQFVLLATLAKGEALTPARTRSPHAVRSEHSSRDAEAIREAWFGLS